MYIDTYLAIPLWIFAIFGLFHFMLHILQPWMYIGKISRGPRP